MVNVFECFYFNFFTFHFHCNKLGLIRGRMLLLHGFNNAYDKHHNCNFLSFFFISEFLQLIGARSRVYLFSFKLNAVYLNLIDSILISMHDLFLSCDLMAVTWKAFHSCRNKVLNAYIEAKKNNFSRQKLLLIYRYNNTADY